MRFCSARGVTLPTSARNSSASPLVAPFILEKPICHREHREHREKMYAGMGGFLPNSQKMYAGMGVFLPNSQVILAGILRVIAYGDIPANPYCPVGNNSQKVFAGMMNSVHQLAIGVRRD